MTTVAAGTALRRFEGRRLVVATHNAGKVAEMTALFAPMGIDLVTAATLGLPEPEETEATFEGNARIKALAAAVATGCVALADDSGIEVDALGGLPGVRTADWAIVPGGRDFTVAMARVHDDLIARQAPEPWTARFRCCLALAWPDGHVEVAAGCVEGRVVWPMRGPAGHGFDPIFVPDGRSVTFAEMLPEDKNAISHRAVAFERLLRRCFT
ncbi:MAG: non-canonical purine NTP pyrophosphatase [Gemmobacter sp.]